MKATAPTFAIYLRIYLVHGGNIASDPSASDPTFNIASDPASRSTFNIPKLKKSRIPSEISDDFCQVEPIRIQ
jgi:hypothetical protein